MKRLFAIVLVMACKKSPPPSCEAVGKHAADHFTVGHPASKDELAKLLHKPPWIGRVTAADRQFLEKRCESWDADYRTCILTSRTRVACGSSDHDWVSLPSQEEWQDGLREAARSVKRTASDRYVAMMGDVGRAQDELAGAKTQPERDAANAKLAAANEAMTRAKALDEACRERPLEQAGCVALLDPKP